MKVFFVFAVCLVSCSALAFGADTSDGAKLDLILKKLDRLQKDVARLEERITKLESDSVKRAKNAFVPINDEDARQPMSLDEWQRHEMPWKTHAPSGWDSGLYVFP